MESIDTDWTPRSDDFNYDGCIGHGRVPSHAKDVGRYRVGIRCTIDYGVRAWSTRELVVVLGGHYHHCW